MFNNWRSSDHSYYILFGKRGARQLFTQSPAHYRRGCLCTWTRVGTCYLLDNLNKTRVTNVCCVVIITRGLYTHTFTRTQGQASVRGKLRGHARVNYTCFYLFFLFTSEIPANCSWHLFIYHTDFKADYFVTCTREGGCVYVYLLVIIIIIIF